MTNDNAHPDALPRLATGELAGSVPAWLTIEQVAAVLQVSSKTLRRGFVPGGDFNLLPRKKIGRVWRFQTRGVVEFAENFMD